MMDLPRHLRRHSLETTKFYLFIIVVISGNIIFFRNQYLGDNTIPNTIVDFPLEAKPKQQHDFAYDRERWERNSARFVVLAGPHKTASTTLQTFFERIAHLTVSVLNRNATQLAKVKTPHPAVTDWVWPAGVRGECIGNSWSATEFRFKPGPKFYSTLGSLISGRYAQGNFRSWYDEEKRPKADMENRKAGVAAYFRSLFRKPWEEGKNILIGSEELDSLVALVDVGEELHVASSSSGMIDNLLDLLPWDNTTATAESSDGSDNGNARSPPLQLEDIEVQINLRTPRISHAISIWKQRSGKKSFQKFLLDPNVGYFFYQINSFGLALQYARRGIKTTIIDMAGVGEKELRDSTEQTNRTEGNGIIGGLEGVVACDILRMGKNNDNSNSTTSNNNATAFCDDYSRLHLPGYVKEARKRNVRDDKQSRDMTDEQLEKIEGVLNALDCSIWKHLKKYQASGTLRILYPSENLLATCDPEGIKDKDVSFLESLWNVKSVASEGLSLWDPGLWHDPR